MQAVSVAAPGVRMRLEGRDARTQTEVADGDLEDPDHRNQKMIRTHGPSQTITTTTNPPPENPISPWRGHPHQSPSTSGPSPRPPSGTCAMFSAFKKQKPSTRYSVAQCRSAETTSDRTTGWPQFSTGASKPSLERLGGGRKLGGGENTCDTTEARGKKPCWAASLIKGRWKGQVSKRAELVLGPVGTRGSWRFHKVERCCRNRGERVQKIIYYVNTCGCIYVRMCVYHASLRIFCISQWRLPVPSPPLPYTLTYL
ncbi:hypothetical protein Vretifemale_5923 [Volvox reticuliferus]|uniref:Uncharacterized protein n=1 Tax=Volvox reticuliferus TaxID=1737510 RepID=A0A8J4C7Q1_9CHLO|nr:hypothetical protein Vretifemale_5923 [Volvox reticuliferus]